MEERIGSTADDAKKARRQRRNGVPIAKEPTASAGASVSESPSRPHDPVFRPPIPLSSQARVFVDSRHAFPPPSACPFPILPRMLWSGSARRSSCCSLSCSSRAARLPGRRRRPPNPVPSRLPAIKKTSRKSRRNTATLSPTKQRRMRGFLRSIGWRTNFITRFQTACLAMSFCSSPGLPRPKINLAMGA